MIELPDVVRNRAVAEGLTQWVEDLPEIVRGLERDWAIEVGRSFTEGTEAFVAEAQMIDGSTAVLKVLVPRRSGAVDDHEAAVLRLADGDGCPILYRDDPARGALLMERLGPSMFALGLPYEQRLPILCDATSLIWRPATDADLPTGAEKAARDAARGSGRAARRRPDRNGAVDGRAARPRRRCDLGVGSRRAGLDRPRHHEDRPATGRPSDARPRRPTRHYIRGQTRDVSTSPGASRLHRGSDP